MSRSNKTRPIRRRLLEKDNRCHWCGIPTRWLEPTDGSLPADAATLDHLYSRTDPRRGTMTREPNVLSCFRCNNKRGSLAPETFARHKGETFTRQQVQAKGPRACEPLSLALQEAGIHASTVCPL